MKDVACDECGSTYPLRLSVSVSLVDALASVLMGVLVLVLALKHLQSELRAKSKLRVKAAHNY